MSEPLSTRAADLRDHLADWPRSRVSLAELLTAFDQTDPGSRGTTDLRSLLADTLHELAGHRHIELPADPSWDRTQQPPLPKFITRPNRKPAPIPAKDTVWHSSLAWVAGTRITATQRGHLETLNTWLHRTRPTTTIPMRERSLEIFGNEKQLDGLLVTGLFAPDRLTLELIKARRVAPRITTARVGDGPVLLVVENSDTFDSLINALTNNPDQVGVVGWGAGGGFEASVLSIPNLKHNIEAIYYYGDLDNNGLQIPARANQTAQATGQLPVRPARGLYQALLDQGTPQPGQRRLKIDTATQVAEWLPESLRAQVIDLLTGGHRLAQEATGITHLANRDGWANDLRVV